MKQRRRGNGPRQDGCTCGELVPGPEHLAGCPVVPMRRLSADDLMRLDDREFAEFIHTSGIKTVSDRAKS